MQSIDITPFEKAINSLGSILERYKRDNYDIDIRDAVILRFEYTYSLAIRIMKKYISAQMPEVPTDLTFNEIIRQANKFGLLKNNLIKWTDYRQKRNMTSHTYDETVAKEVIAIIPEFKDEAQYLLGKLKELI